MAQILSIVIPVYNEERTITEILDSVKQVELHNNIDKEIILVNDASTDGTDDVIKEYISDNPKLGISYYTHEKNKGKGAALHTGIAKAKGDFTIIQDADLEYDPNEYNSLLKPIINGHAYVVYGSRFKGSNPH